MGGESHLLQKKMQLPSTDEANQFKPSIFRQDIRFVFFTPDDSAITFSYHCIRIQFQVPDQLRKRYSLRNLLLFAVVNNFILAYQLIESFFTFNRFDKEAYSSSWQDPGQN